MQWATGQGKRVGLPVTSLNALLSFRQTTFKKAVVNFKLRVSSTSGPSAAFASTISEREATDERGVSVAVLRSKPCPPERSPTLGIRGIIAVEVDELLPLGSSGIVGCGVITSSALGIGI